MGSCMLQIWAYSQQIYSPISKTVCFHAPQQNRLCTISLPSFTHLVSIPQSSILLFPAHLGEEGRPHLPFTLLHQDWHQLLPFQGNVHGCVPILIFSIHIAAFTDQQLHQPYMSLDDSEVQRCLVPAVLDIDITATLEEKNCIKQELLLLLSLTEEECCSCACWRPNSQLHLQDRNVSTSKRMLCESAPAPWPYDQHTSTPHTALTQHRKYGILRVEKLENLLAVLFCFLPLWWEFLPLLCDYWEQQGAGQWSHLLFLSQPTVELLLESSLWLCSVGGKPEVEGTLSRRKTMQNKQACLFWSAVMNVL